MADFPAPAEGILVTLFLTVRDVPRSRDFYGASWAARRPS
jgi:hypothetical protein